MREGSRFETFVSRTSTTPRWFVDMVYIETICGVAQIIRDPSVRRDEEYTFGQFYYSLPSPSGGFSVADEVPRLQGPSNAEKALCGFYDDIMSEV